MIGVGDGFINGDEMAVVVEICGEVVNGARGDGNGRGWQVSWC